MQPGIDLVVCNYRTSDDLAEFLDSIDKYPIKTPHDVYVVNVDPQEEDRHVAHEWLGLHPKATEVDIPWNCGYARACNKAAAMGSRHVIALCNADIAWTDGAMDALYDALRAHPLWGIIGPRQVDQDGRIVAGGILGTNEHPVQRGWMQPDDGCYSDTRSDAVMVAGSAFLIRRTLWDELTECEIFREVFPEAEGAMPEVDLFFEDTWVSHHAKAHSYRNVYFGSVCVQHKFHRSVKRNGLLDKHPGEDTKSRQLFDASKKVFVDLCERHGITHN